MAKHNIGIIGAGPVGSIMAAHLAKNGEKIFLVDIKEDLISAVEKKGITVADKDSRFTVRMNGTGNFTASLARPTGHQF